jgi:hypothetical protein
LTAIYYTTPTGVVSYNGVTLNPTVSYKLSGTAIEDDAQRSYMYTEYTLEGRFVIFGDVSESVYTAARCSTRMQEIRNLLSAPGQELKLTGIGFGDMVVNSPANGRILVSSTYVNDVNFGPKPKVIDCAPYGDTAWEVIWTCTFSIIEPRASNEYALTALNYKLDFSSDHRGLTTIDVSGHYQIPLSYANYQANSFNPGKLTGPIQADAFRDRIFVQAPTDFRPRSVRTSFNEAKNRVDFSYQLVEAEGEAFPPGIVAADIDESWDNDGPQNFSGFNGTINGWMEVAKGYPVTTAPRQFLNIFTSRLNYIRSQASVNSNGGKFTPTVIPMRFSFGCKRFTRRYDFSAEYAVVGCLPDFLKSSGIWEPLGTDHNTWITSLQGVFNNRGVSQVKPGLDVIIRTGNTQRKENFNVGFTTVKPADGAPVSTLTFDCASITETNSYLAYENNVRVVKESSAQFHKFAQAPGSDNSSTTANGFTSPSVSSSVTQTSARLIDSVASAFGVFGVAGQTVDAVKTNTSNPRIASSATASNTANTKPDAVEYTSTSTDYIVMYGKAMRIKFVPQVPTIEKIGQSKATLKEEHVEAPRVMAMIGDCPVYSIRWAKVYYFPDGLPSTEVKPTAPAQWACLQPFG